MSKNFLNFHSDEKLELSVKNLKNINKSFLYTYKKLTPNMNSYSVIISKNNNLNKFALNSELFINNTSRILDEILLMQTNIQNIFKDAITSLNKSEHIKNVEYVCDNFKIISYNLYKIDWYIHIWSLPFKLFDDTIFKLLSKLNSKNINNYTLSILDISLYNLFKNTLYTKENFIDLFSNNDLYLYDLYVQKRYIEIVILCLHKIESILTNFINYLENKTLPNVNDYLSKNRKERAEYKSFTIGQKEEYMNKIQELKQKKNNSFDAETLMLLELFFDDSSPAQLYHGFDKGKFICQLNILGEIPLCRNLFLHGMVRSEDVSKKLAIKALCAYHFFTFFRV